MIRRARGAHPWMRSNLSALIMAGVLAALCGRPSYVSCAPVANQQANVATPQAAAADTLERTARASFGDLTEAEIGLVRNAPYRKLVWSSPSSDADNPVNDPSKAEGWGKERSIRAEIISWLLTDAQASRLVHPSGVGIAGARVVGGIDLTYLTAPIPLTIIDSSIPDGMDLSYAHVQAIDLRKSWTGPISAQRAVVQGDVGLSFGHYGNVSFFRSEIDGDLDCNGGHFVGDEPVSAIATTIKGDAVFHQGFETGGTVDFRLARIGQSLSFNDAHFIGTHENGLNAERAEIGGTVYWVDIKIGPHTQLDLGDAHAGSLWDTNWSWPTGGNLFLVGFVYSSFSGGPMTADSRLEWLHRQPPALWGQPQPYRRLAQVLRDNGSEEGAIKVEIAREDALAMYGGLPRAARLWKLALWATIGYGYRPLRALWWILAFVILGTVLFRWGYDARLIAPTEEGAYESFVKTGKPPPHYPLFSSFVYSLENFLPVVDLHQGTYWRPNPQHKSIRPPRILKSRDRGTMPATLLRGYLWLHILAGWTITPLLFAGLAGLLRS
jgi:hypothetical protein